MIITLTLNPAVDLTVTLDEFLPEDTNRITSSRTDPGGKGINVSRVLWELGCESLAMGFVSGTRGKLIEQALRDQGIFTDFLHTTGQTRTNVTILERKHNTTTTLNEPGPATDPHHVPSLLQRLRKQLSPGDWLVVGGSIPPGLDPGLYGDIVRLARDRGVKCILDTDGAPLLRGIMAKPFLVKPNRTEVERILGRMPKHRDPLIRAAEHVHAAGVEVVVLSQGSHGAVLVSEQGMLRAYPPAVPTLSGVGSGDAMVAGMVYVLSQGGGLEDALRLGSAAGAAAALTPGTALCYRSDVVRLLPKVMVHPIEQPAEPAPPPPELAPAGSR